MAEYPLDHGSGYAPIPRAVRSFEPLIKEPRGVLARIWLIVQCRARHEAGWARGSHGNVWLEAGECIAGARDLASALDITKNTAHRALVELEELGLIARKAGQLGTVVSVPNFGSYGENAPQQWDSSGTPSGTAPGHPLGRKERENGETGERENGSLSAPGASGLGERAPSEQGQLSLEGEGERAVDAGDAGKRSTRKDPPEWAGHLADELRQAILSAKPDHAIGAKWTAATRRSWANTLRLAVERDERTVERLRAGIEFIAGGQGGTDYPLAIESAGALRSKFDRLEAAMRRNAGKRGSVGWARPSESHEFAGGEVDL